MKSETRSKTIHYKRAVITNSQLTLQSLLKAAFDSKGKATKAKQRREVLNSDDQSCRLINDNISGQTYQYDANGNRTSLTLGGTTYFYDTALTSNHLLTVQGPIAKTYSYDAAGNIASDGTTAFTWNAGGRLSKAVTGTKSNTYKHNGRGERVIKSLSKNNLNNLSKKPAYSTHGRSNFVQLIFACCLKVDHILPAAPIVLFMTRSDIWLVNTTRTMP